MQSCIEITHETSVVHVYPAEILNTIPTFTFEENMRNFKTCLQDWKITNPDRM